MYLPIFMYQMHYYTMNNVMFLDSATTNPETAEGFIAPDSDLAKMLQEIWDIFKIAVPILIIVLSIIDFVVAIAKDEEAMKKAQMKLLKRLVVGVAFFVIPVILEFIFAWTKIGGLIGLS